MKQSILLLILVTILQGCRFGDNPSVYQKELPGDLQPSAMFSMEEMALFKKNRAVALINSTITKIGWTEKYVIAQSHPYPHRIPYDTVGSRVLFGEIQDSSDVRYFRYHYKQDVVKVNGTWHLRYPYVELKTDSTTEYKVLPLWYILDIENNYTVYTTYSYTDFLEKRKIIGLPDTLSFFLNFRFEQY